MNAWGCKYANGEELYIYKNRERERPAGVLTSGHYTMCVCRVQYKAYGFIINRVDAVRGATLLPCP